MNIQDILAQLMQGGASPSGMPWSDQQNIPPPMPGAPTAPPAAPPAAAPAPESPDPQAGMLPGGPAPAPIPGATPPTAPVKMPTPAAPGAAPQNPLLGAIKKFSPFNAQHTPMDAARDYMTKLLAGG